MMDSATQRGGIGAAWWRISLLAGAVGFSIDAFLRHDRVVPDWWTWAAEFAVAATLFVVALGKLPDPPEAAARVWLRRILGIISAILLASAFQFGGIRGKELGAGAATIGAIVAFLLARWVPIGPRDIACLNGGDDTPARRRMPALAGIAVGLAAAVAAAALNLSNPLAGATLWLGAMLVLAASMALFGGAAAAEPTEWQRDGGPQLTCGGEALAVLIVFLFAAALRLPYLDRIPAFINSDEGRLGRYAMTLFKDGFPDFFGLGWNAFPHISLLADIVPIRILGMGIENLRLASAIFGLAGLLAFWFWVRRWWGNVIALLAMLLLAGNQEHVSWSRTGLNNIQQVTVAVLMMAAFARALQRRRPLDWLLFGYATGFSFLVYHAAKLFPALMFAIALVWVVGIAGFLRRNLAGGLIALLGFVVALGPHLVTIYVDWFNFYHNTSNRMDVGLLIEALRGGNTEAARSYLSSHVLTTLFLFTTNDLPFLDPFACVVAVPAVGWMLWRWRDPRHTAVLVWFFGILVIGGMITQFPPNVPRLIGVLPFACILPAVAAGRFRELCHRVMPARADLVCVPILALWLSASLFHNWRTGFVLRPEMQQADQMTNLCRIIGRTPLPAIGYTIGGLGEVDTGIAPIDCMMPLDVERTSVGLADDPTLFPIRPSHSGTALFVFTQQQFALLPLMRHYYPTAVYEPIFNRDGVPHLWTVTLSPELIDRHRGLRLATGKPGSIVESAHGQDALRCADCMAFPEKVAAKGLLYIAAPGAHSFRAEGAAITIDGGRVASDSDIALAAGWHEIRAEAMLTRADHEVWIEWKTPGAAEWQRIPRNHLNTHPSGHGLLGRYFAASLPIGDPKPSAATPDYLQIAPALSFDANPERDEVPPPGFAAKGATMEWIGTVDLGEGDTHTFRLDTTSAARVFIDGIEVANNPGGAPSVPTEVTLSGLGPRAEILVRTVREPQPKVWYWWTRLFWRLPGGDWTAFADYHPPER